MKKDLLETILRINYSFGHITIQWSSTTGRYHYSGRKLFIANVILLFFVQIFYLYCILLSKERFYDMYGVVLGTFYQLDGQLTLCLNYIMVFNGILRTKDILKLLNSLRKVRVQINTEFGRSKYAAV